ncbi:MAG TPA: sugar ABC transporter permease [Armatimonadota bacterium]|nr:sugar ABC transporter permease [Armatimonadota bacterium]
MHKRRLGKLARGEAIDCYMFISPWVIGFLIFTLGPMLFSIGLSFCRWDIFRPADFVGLENYRKLTADPLFVKSLANTLFYAAFAVPIGIAGALGLSMLLNQKIRGISIYRTIYYLPAILSGVAVALLWRWILNPDYGVLNAILADVFGIAHPPQWLMDESWSKPSLILMSLWGVGGGMVIFLAGLQGIPEQLYEAAQIDGANVLQRFRHITLPMLSPVIFFNLIMGVIASFQVFTQVYIMTGGGPANSTLFYVLYLFNNGFRFFKMGYASALAWVLFVIIMGVTLIQFKLARRWVYYEGVK